jgi:hypothetical protein
VLLIEIISSTATIGYAVLLIKYSKSRRTKGLPIAKKGQQPDLDNLMFHVRVLIPCYKESTELVRTTVLGAVKAPLPRNTLRTVYLCDDGKVRPHRGVAVAAAAAAAAAAGWAAAAAGRGGGGGGRHSSGGGCGRQCSRDAGSRLTPLPPAPAPPPQDPSKEAMIRDLNAEYGCLEYVAGRKRDPAGETNGKSNNLNHCLKNVVYKDYWPVNPNGPKIPKTEVMVVFDADMVAKPNFFTKVRTAAARGSAGWQSGAVRRGRAATQAPSGRPLRLAGSGGGGGPSQAGGPGSGSRAPLHPHPSPCPHPRPPPPDPGGDAGRRHRAVPDAAGLQQRRRAVRHLQQPQPVLLGVHAARHRRARLHRVHRHQLLHPLRAARGLRVLPHLDDYRGLRPGHDPEGQGAAGRGR